MTAEDPDPAPSRYIAPMTGLRGAALNQAMASQGPETI